MEEIEGLQERLKNARQNKGYSQGYVAEQLNITRQSISKWENGKTYPDIDNLVILSKLYDVSLDMLINGEEAEDINGIRETKNDNDTQLNNSFIEETFLGVILTVSCLFPILGVFVPIGTFVWMKIHNKKYKIISILAVLCLIISLYNSAVVFNEWFFHAGESNVMKL